MTKNWTIVSSGASPDLDRLPVSGESISDFLEGFPTVTKEQVIAFQQNLPKFDISVLVLRARTNGLRGLAPLVPKTVDALTDPKRGKAVFIDS